MTQESKETQAVNSNVTPIVTKNIFFNVPSKNRLEGPRTNPEITNKENTIENDQESQKISNFIKKNRTLLIAILITIIVFSVAGYFVYKYILETPPEAEIPVSVLTPKPKPTTSNQPTTPKSEITSLWLQKYFKFSECKEEQLCGDKSDPDHDGLTNVDEFKLGTDPNNPDSDSEGIADGDEVNIFDTSPLQISTTGSSKYSDADDARSGYDSKTPGKKYTAQRISEISSKIKQFGVHQPTISTLGDSLINIYGFTSDSAQPSPTPTQTNSNLPTGLDITPEALLDRDTQRSSTMKKLGVSLVKYKNDVGSYPITESFTEMTSKIKPYNLVATSSQDPINKEPYIYTYNSQDGKTFYLTYYSETQKTLIKYSSSTAEKDYVSEDSGLRDEQRMQDLESLRTALITYSTTKIAGNQSFVFPPVSKYKSELVPKFLSQIPKDPKTQSDYDYQVGTNFDSFTIKAVLESPSQGTTGYLCNQEECRKY